MASSLIGLVCGGQTFECPPEWHVAHDSAPKVDIQSLLLQGAVERWLSSEDLGNLDSPIDRSGMGNHLVHHAPLKSSLRVDGLSGPQEPLRACGARDLFPDDMHPVAPGYSERGMWVVAIGGLLGRDMDVGQQQILGMD